MKNIHFKLSLIIGIAVALTISSCGESLLENLDPNQSVGSGDGSLDEANSDNIAGLFLTAQQKLHDIGTNGGPHVYQVQFNIHIDNYAGYMAGTQNFSGNLPSTYAYFPDYANSPKVSFFNVSQATMPVIRAAKKLGLQEIGAMCEIMYCYSALELSDIYGPFPWYDYRLDKQESPLTYEPVSDIYDSIFVHLKESAKILEEYTTTSKEHQDSVQAVLNSYDRICGANTDNWRRFANTICMRMALRMSNVNPERAKAEAQAAINAGLITKNVEYNVAMESLMNPVAFISYQWNDTRLNASMENIMKRLHFPIMDIWFQNNSGSIEDSKGNVTLEGNSAIVGMRTGIPTTARDGANQYVKFSGTATTYGVKPVYLLKMSERYFLEAEAEVRWGIGSLLGKQLYDNGIKELFKDENINATDNKYKNYYAQEEADQTINYIDYHDNGYNLDGIITIGVKWNEKDDPKIKLEKIITQKWLANFPQGLEAWNDLRRTGYPRIFPVEDIGDGSLTSGQLIRRIPWDMTQASSLEDIESTGIPALGGSNEEVTRLWWDCTDPAGLSDNDRF